MLIKSAEEWIQDWRKRVDSSPVLKYAKSDNPEFRKLEADWIQQIQADALLHAAEIVRIGREQFISRGSKFACEYVQEHIERAAQKLKEGK